MKIQAITEYLNEPIPRKQVLVGVAMMSASYAMLYVDRKVALKNAAEVFHDQEERIRILLESVNYLIARADDRTATELNQKLDFWRVVRGIPTDDSN